jgi:hypothetical protein
MLNARSVAALAAVAAVMVVAACGSRTNLGASSPPKDAGLDATEDVGVDAGREDDTGPDAEPDARPEGKADAGPDAPADAGPDAPADAGLDAGADASQDAGLCAAVSGLFAYYPLDDDLLDHSGNGFDAIGNVSLTPAGKVAGAALFDGSASSLHATGAAVIPSARTFCAWVFTEARSGLGQPLFSAGSVNVGDFLSVSSSSPAGGTCTFLAPLTPFVDHWGTPCFDDVALSAPLSSWDLVCYAYDGVGALTFYVDGQSGVTAGGEYGYPIGSLYLGSTAIGGTTTQASLLGALDEVTVWDRALGDADFSALWNGGAGCRVR